jgi:peptidoglycan/LPS O-acetylase OafA/YrhL
MTEILRIRRSRGMASGFLLVLLGLWGALVPFVGPYFHYAYTPDTAWTYTSDRLWLEILPGAAVFLGGVLLVTSAARHVALFGALLAAAAGAWFTLGTTFSPLWNNNVPLGGSPASLTVTMRIAEQVGFFTGLGVVVAAIAAVAFGRLISLPVEAVAVPAETVPAETVAVPAQSVPSETETEIVR